MKKNRGILVLVLTAIITGFLVFTSAVGFGPTGTGAAKNIKTGLDLSGGVSITYEASKESPTEDEMADTIYKLQKRVEHYSSESQVYKEGENRIIVEIPGAKDANKILEELGKPGSLYFIKHKDSAGEENYTYNAEAKAYELTKTIEEIEADGGIVLTGTDIKDAKAAVAQDDLKNNVNVVSLSFTKEGTDKFAVATKEAVEAGNDTIGIYYDGTFVSVPSVKQEIKDGQAQIDGMKDAAEAENLASTIRIGGLKLELEELHSKVVGAQLGVEAIDTSLKAGAIGCVLVAVFMIAVYYISGVASVVGLSLYVALVVLLLNGFDMTLTLSGIAGIILSIGMAVDANVIIFARIREELAAGMSVKTAMKVGFDKALSAIVDSNITTLIAAGVLLLLAPGSVKGFAQTLALGIVLSMFTALVVTKLVMQAFYALGIRDKKWYGVAKERKTIDFLSKKGIFFGISIAVIAAGFIVMGVNKVTTGDAMNYSLEFKGGTATTVTFNTNKTLEEVNSEIVPLVEEITGSAVQIQTVQDTNEVIFKTSTLDVEQREALNEMFMENFGVKEEKITSETISSTISDEMTSDTIIAVVVAIICMLIYIRVRFSDIRFGISSIVALLHDVLVVVAFYAVAKVSVGNTFIACILTIVGYSINATIVIFDRVRENMNVMTKKDTLKDVVNKSITQTLSRSIFTSLTTFIMVAALYILGVTSIRDFALPLMVGIVCGAYSSVCLTGAIWYLLRIKFPPKASK